MWTAFPSSDYYGSSVAVGLAPRRRSRVSLVDERFERHVGTLVVPLSEVIPHRPPGRGFVPPTAIDGISGWLRNRRRERRMSHLHRWRLRFKQSSLYRVTQVSRGPALSASVHAPL